MLDYPRLNEISYRIEGFNGTAYGGDSNYRITGAQLLAEENEETWSLTVQRKKDDGRDFMQEVLGRIGGCKGEVHFRVSFALITGDKISLVFAVEDLPGEKDGNGRKE